MKSLTRRSLISAGAASVLLLPRLADAAARTLTPPATEGPFYPDRLPLDTDNDLLRIGPGGKQATGQIFHLTGRVVDKAGLALPGFSIEIWQCDANGVYRHTGDTRRDASDPYFQGFGRTATDRTGRYRFRTITPVSYPGRTPHIHFKVRAANRREFTSQLYIAGHPQNESDFLYRRLGSPGAKKAASVDLTSAPELDQNAVKGTFDIVLD